MKPVDVTFTFTAELNPEWHGRGNYSSGNGDSKHSYAGYNMLDSFCQTLTNKFVVKNPNVKVSWYGIETKIDFISAEICVQKITDKETLDTLIDDIKDGQIDIDFDGKFDIDYNEYRVYDSP